MTSGPRGGNRLFLVYAGSALALSVLHGTLVAVHFGCFASPYGALEVVPRMTSLSIVRELGPATSVSAALLALVAWGHEVGGDVVSRTRVRALAWALVAAACGSFVVVPLTAMWSLVVAHRALGVSWTGIRSASDAVVFADLGSAVRAFVIGAGSLGAATMVALPRLSRSARSCRVKLGVAWIGSVLVQLVVLSLWRAISLFR